jgi:asparagine synthase (glutamine-hydrolysing)
MSGIVGIIARNRAEHRPVLEKMVQALGSVAPYTCGTSVNESLELCAGWASAAGAFSDGMPVWNEKKNVFLLFSGQEYSDNSELNNLRARGHHFNSGDASYLIHMYEELGAGFLQNLNGGFCGLLGDLRTQKIILFNDRYGLNRVYFHQSERGFYFASQAKCLLKVLPELRRLELDSLGEFLSCGCVLQNRTLFEKMMLLPPGSAWTFTGGQLTEKTTYFDGRPWEEQPELEPGAYYEELKTAWQRLLPRYFRGDAPIALSMTGGVDSRMILGWALRTAGQLPCYTFGGRYRDCADVKISQQLARLCGQKHEVLPIGDEFLSHFPGLAEKAVYLSDGACDVTGAIDLYVQERARRIAPVRVTGTNGGEILRRLVAFKPALDVCEMFAPEVARSVEAAQATYARELEGHPLSFTAFKQAPWFMGSKFVLERTMLELRMPYFDNDLVRLAYRAPKELLDDNQISLRLAGEGNPVLANVGTDRNQGQGKARHLFQEFTYKAEYAYDYGMPQWLAKIDRVLAPLQLEKLFLGRHKIAHFRVFYRDELAGYVKEMLLDSRTLQRPCLDRSKVENMVMQHLEGRGNYTRQIHKLLTLELITRELLERN